MAKLVVGENDLATRFPELAATWSRTRNGGLLPIQVSAGSIKKAWWLCPTCGHEWQATVNHRALGGNGCPACAGKTVVPGRNDLATTYPSLAAELHPTRNGELTAMEVSAGSTKKPWWRCPACSHEWQATVANRALGGSGCPACAKAPAPGRDLATTYPSLAAELHPTRNGELTAMEVSAGSTKKPWWRCPACSHEWQAKVADRALGGSGCPACAKAPAPGRDLATTHPDLAAELHPTRNGELTASKVSAGSRQKPWWLCPACNHEWQTTVASRALKGSGCPACVSAWTAVRIARFAEGILPYALSGELLASEVDTIASAAGMSPGAKQRLVEEVRARRLQGAEGVDGPVDTTDHEEGAEPQASGLEAPVGGNELVDGGEDELGELGVEELTDVADAVGTGVDDGVDAPSSDESDDEQVLRRLRVEEILRAGGVLAAVDDTRPQSSCSRSASPCSGGRHIPTSRPSSRRHPSHGRTPTRRPSAGASVRSWRQRSTSISPPDGPSHLTARSSHRT